MKPAFIFSMYDEHNLVLASIKAIRSVWPVAPIVVVHSNDGTATDDLNAIHSFIQSYHVLTDLSKTMSRFEYPAAAVCRNFSYGFRVLGNIDTESDVIVALTGDTLITDALNFDSLYQRMCANNWVAMVSHAIGQSFHADTDDPAAGKVCGRFQSWLTTDFACCLFLVNGPFARTTGAFQQIPVTNKFTSEQCLGDELVRCLGNPETFKVATGLLNWEDPLNCYRYNNGILYHAKHQAPAGRHI